MRWGGLPHAVEGADAPTAEAAGDITRLWLRSLRSRERVVDSSTRAVVTMTTHGARLSTVWVALESIGRGAVRPGRLVLWLEEPRRALPWRLRRLVRRGLDVRFVPAGDGVHTKYRPCLADPACAELPLVTSDDDIVYPPQWLAQLLAAHAATPEVVVAHRAHRMRVVDGVAAPYATWVAQATSRPSAASFGTSVSGQLLPVALLHALRERGEAFRLAAPTADDVWIHATAIEAGILVRQVADGQRHYPFVPGTQMQSGTLTGLNRVNVVEGGNDRQIASSYSPAALARIEADGARDAAEARAAGR